MRFGIIRDRFGTADVDAPPIDRAAVVPNTLDNTTRRAMHVAQKVFRPRRGGTIR